MRRREAFDRFARVTAEFEAASFAVAHVLALWGSDPAVTLRAQQAEVTLTELARSAATLEVTFTLRLFAEFEAVVRDYWSQGLGRTTRPDMRPLMDSVARRRAMNGADLQSAHDVRQFRNDVIHACLLQARLDLADCQRGLGRYLRWLPPQW